MRNLHWFFKVALTTLSLVLLWVFLNFGLPTILPTQTIKDEELKGVIFQNQVWEGTVRITGDLVTTLGVSINVKPGTKVLIANGGDKSNFNFLPWQLKKGINTKGWYHGVNVGEPFWDEKEKIQVHLSKLFALGTEEQPIVIKSDSANGSPYDINTISVNKGILVFTQLSNYRRLEIGPEVTVRDSMLREVGECALCMSSGRPAIFNNVFESALREDIWVERASPRITDNLFINLGGSGIRIDSKRFSSPVISNNTFEMPKNYAIDILSGGELNEGVISFNEFSGGSIFRIACDSRVRVSQNSILNNIAFAGNGCGGTFVFGPNYFGTPDIKTVLSEKIIEKDKHFEVKIPTILLSPPKGVGRR